MKLNKDKCQIFFEGDDGSGGGGGGGGGEGNLGGGGEPAPAPTPSPTLDPKAFAQEFGSVIADQFKQQQQSAPKTYTPEQIAEARKKLNFWEPDDTFIKDFGNLETQKEAFLRMRDGLTNQFTTIVQEMLQGQQTQWDSKFAPVQSLLEQRQEADREDRFNKAYPILAKPTLRPLMTAVANELAKADKFKGLTESQCFAELAKGVEAVIKETNPDFKLEAVDAAPANNRRGNSIPSTSSGSGGAAGGGDTEGGGGGKRPKAVSFFPKIRG